MKAMDAFELGISTTLTMAVDVLLYIQTRAHGAEESSSPENRVCLYDSHESYTAQTL